MRESYGLPNAFCLRLLLALTAAFSVANAQQAPPTQGGPSQPPPQIKWEHGPFTAKLGDIAEIQIPAGYEFADAEGARKYLELTGNPPTNNEIGIVTPVGDTKGDDWVILFDFDDTGYIRDNEKSSIDADKLLEDLKKGTEADNIERKKRGWQSFYLTDWTVRPFYDEGTHNLTWGTVGHDDKNAQTINYATRILGRKGVMRVDLVTDPETVSATLPRFKTMMTGFTFNAGSRYADFVTGDKVAAYGLTALIAGGATAIAIKSGLFAKLIAMLVALWKLIAVAFVALATRMKNIIAAFKNKFRKKSHGELTPKKRNDAN